MFNLLDKVAIKDYQSLHYGMIGTVIAFVVMDITEGESDVWYTVEFETTLAPARFHEDQLTRDTSKPYHHTWAGFCEFVERSGRELDKELAAEGGHDYEYLDMPPITYEMDGTG